ncbi:MAG: holo-ACP synthase [Candidatus Marinimicrobia bacterium]|jgi:holo-[acyl-carrier protein] synthase|nr:holo-ACP synthase [Candidatus Neomarinimicrobiota bacterium]MBT3945487.1 holo-ACP synthase [Candidatus Neomarinimicrobiota bacterium]MBT4155424.1 holo-ACP synthase [Candidatus Neomarinimicrobiota bacterium]MBT4554754.1 holo-ACP synthase [Candidatus Neomarinimicrobiota bacterium]MBT4753020.1 holo-ACP synthase [Candidatus Neomarinimicrobiota bacterium]|tara:strand:- start:188 stop:553 length:366 start_codon:yes stop_codon:yes gene_type:complete
MLPNIFIGTDLVEVSRIQSAIQKTGDRFLNRIFTKTEQTYCLSKSSPEIHFAGRFAAKEAIMKALKSSGQNNPIAFSAIEIQSSSTGEPIVNLLFNHRGICKVSISHTGSHAIASSIYILE